MKKVIITLLCIAILGGGGYAGAMKYKKNQEVIKAEIRILGELPNDDI